MTQPEREEAARQGEVADHVAQNIETIAQLHAEAEEKVGRHQRAIERFAAGVGSRWTPVAIVGAVALWIAFNTLAPHVGLPRVDAAPFPWLQGALSLSAVLMTTIVLATQNRLAKKSARRGDLELQVNLLAEQKSTKVIALLEELRRDLPTVRDRVDVVANAMSEAVDPQAVLSVLDQEPEPESSPPDKEPP